MTETPYTISFASQSIDNYNHRLSAMSMERVIHSGSIKTSTLCALSLFVTLAAENRRANSQEIQGPILIPPGIQRELPLVETTCEERCRMIADLRVLVSNSWGDRKQEWAERVKTDLDLYKLAIKNAKEIDLKEIQAAADFGILTLNMLSVRDALPEDLKESFVNENVLTFHEILIDKIKKIDPGNPDFANFELKASALLSDILWSEAYQSPAILDRACYQYGMNVLNCSPEVLPDRLESFQAIVTAKTKVANSPKLADGFLFHAQRYLDSPDISRKCSQQYTDISRRLHFSEEHAEKLSELSKIAIKQPPEHSFAGAFLGPASAIAMLGSSNITGRNERLGKTADFLDLMSNRRSPEDDLSDINKVILKHAIYGAYSKELFDSGAVKTVEDFERMQQQRLTTVQFAIGFLAGIDSVVSIPQEGSDIPCFTKEEEVNLSALQTSKLKFEQMLHSLTMERWSDENRAKVAVLLISSSINRADSVSEFEEIQGRAAKEVGKYFSAVAVGAKEGRYSNKVGGIMHYPAIQVKGDPAVYADFYYYLREGLAAARYGKAYDKIQGGDEELNNISHTYAESKQTVFICETMEQFYAINPENRPVIAHQSCRPNRMKQEVFRIMNKFPCFRGDVALQIRLSDSEDIIAELSLLKEEAKRKEALVYTRIQSIFEKAKK